MKCFFTFHVILDQILNILISAILKIYSSFICDLEKVISKVIYLLYLVFWNDFFCTTTKEWIFLPFNWNKDRLLNILFSKIIVG